MLGPKLLFCLPFSKMFKGLCASITTLVPRGISASLVFKILRGDGLKLFIGPLIMNLNLHLCFCISKNVLLTRTLPAANVNKFCKR